MSLYTRLRSVHRRNQSNESLDRGTAAGRKRARLLLESLEDRTLFSVHVLSSIKGMDTNTAGGIVEPPDPIAAAGPTAVVEEINSNIAYYNKATGAQLFTQDLGTFFSNDLAQSLFSDVNVTYDEQAGRFFVSTMDIDFGTSATGQLASYFDFAISNDSNPMHGFKLYQIKTDEVSPRTNEQLFTDFPRLGWNADAYVVAFNMFGFNSEYQYGVQLLTIDKSKLLGPNPTLSYHQVDRPLPNSTMVPAVMHGSAPGDPMWFVEEKGLEQDGSYADLRVVKMTNVLSATPTFTDYYVPIDAYTITPFPQDTAGTVSNVLDTRILNVDWRNNQMAVAQNVGIEIDTNVHARWYEISTAGAAPSLAQLGTLNPGAGIDTYMPSVALAPDGTIGMTYMESAAGVEDMSMYVTGRAPTDPLGTMQVGVKVSPAPVPGQLYNYGGSRIGDFSGITLDPTDPTKFWAVNEYAIIANQTLLTFPNWGTYIGQFNVDTTPAIPHLIHTGSGGHLSPKPGTTIPAKSDNLGRSRGRLLLPHPPVGTHRGNGGHIVPSTPGGGGSPRLVKPGVKFPGLNTNDAGGIVEPPDPIAAAGPTAIVEIVNSNIAYYDKAKGTRLFTQDLGTFFSNDTVQSLFSDVYVTFDELAGRFFVSTMDIDFGTTVIGQMASYFDFAISNDSDPLHGFKLYQIKTDEVSSRTSEQLFTDFPRLGWNADAYVVAFNMFGFNSMYQYNVKLLTIDKTKLLGPTPTLSYHQVDRPLPNSTMVPAEMHGSAPGDPMWFVEEKGLEQDGSYADLRMVKMTNVLSATPTFTDYYAPMDAYTITPFPQDTMGIVSNVLDTRILSVDWRSNQMAVAQNVGIASDTNVHARWYEISTAGAAPSMVQEGALNPGAGIDTYMPSAALAPDGTIGLTYIQSAASVQDMSVYVTGRAPTDPTGTMQVGVSVKAGEQNYQGTRIGDFSGITVDPTATTTTFWAVNEYSISTTSIILPNWGTWIASFTVTPLSTSSTGSISGTVFNDLNGDGVQELGEPGFNGVTIDLFDASNSLLGSTITATGPGNLAGEFSFRNLPAGNYTVVETVPSGWVATSATKVPATVVAGQDTSGLIFGDFKTVSISGLVFDDLNGDGFQESGEPGLAGWTIDLVQGSTIAQKATTNASGNFSLTNVGPGSFKIQEEVQTGWVQTSSPTTYAAITSSGTNLTGAIFGNTAPATHFVISAPSSTTAGAGFSFTVTALDAFNNTAGSYRGTVTFTTSDPRASRPANYKFTSADAGVHTFAATLRTAGSQSITATDTVTSTVTGSQSITVNVAMVNHLILSRFPSKTTAGVAQTFRVTAQDLYGNTVTSFTDTVSFSSSDGQAVLPANYSYVSTDAGVHNFSATLKTAGIQTLTVKDMTNPGVTSATRTGITVVPAATSQLLVSGFPQYVTAGVSYNFTVTAQDPYGNTTPAYRGTAKFSSTDGLAVLPGNYLFVTADAGVHIFAATLNSLGTQSISATDTANASITGSESMIVVFPIQPTAGMSGPSLGVPGQPLTFTLTATESGLPASTVYSYNVQWGDGSAVQTLSGPTGTQATHVYVGTGAYTIGMTATDPSGDISMPTSTSVSITTLAMEADPANPNLTALYVGGTPGNDTIAITPVVNNGVDHGINVGMNFVNYGSFFPTGHVVVYGQSGNDIIKTAPVVVSGVTYYVNVPVLFFAGIGNDVLNVSGSAATDALGNILGNVLVGGAGADTLLGGMGRDILIGGSGPSTVRAGSGGDILIGGTTDFDNNAAALAALLAEWDSADAYATRIARITGSMSGGLNGSAFLNSSTVHSDGKVNNLFGGPGMDWYFAGIMDVIFNKTAGEVVTMV